AANSEGLGPDFIRVFSQSRGIALNRLYRYVRRSACASDANVKAANENRDIFVAILVGLSKIGSRRRDKMLFERRSNPYTLIGRIGPFGFWQGIRNPLGP
ncbi:MAG TPA: hypothetical protein VGJ26_21095, partial [Pirellulales bacterium]